VKPISLPSADNAIKRCTARPSKSFTQAICDSLIAKGQQLLTDAPGEKAEGIGVVIPDPAKHRELRSDRFSTPICKRMFYKNKARELPKEKLKEFKPCLTEC